MTNFESVKIFMKTFGQEVKNKASFPNEKIIKLRSDLIEEEFSELKKAFEEKNLETTILIDPNNEEALLMLMKIGYLIWIFEIKKNIKKM